MSHLERRGLYYPSSENKVAITTQLICAFVFAYANNRFSHDATQIFVLNLTRCIMDDL